MAINLRVAYDQQKQIATNDAALKQVTIIRLIANSQDSQNAFGNPPAND